MASGVALAGDDAAAGAEAISETVAEVGRGALVGDGQCGVKKLTSCGKLLANYAFDRGSCERQDTLGESRRVRGDDRV